MDKGKIVIVVLVVIGLLFGFGLVTNLAPKQGENKGAAEYDTSGWVSSMDSLMSYFSPKLDMQRLQPGAGCKVAGTDYKFVNGKKCTINIKKLPDDADDDIQNATLQLGKGVNVRLPCPEGKQPSNKQGVPLLTIIYTPEGDDRAKNLCEGTDEVRLVAQKKGGTLEMTCTGCTTKRPVLVKFE